MSTRARRFGFVLLPGHSLLACGGATEALAAANDVLGELRYESLLLSVDGAGVSASCGTQVLVHGRVSTARQLAAAVVVSDSLPPGPPASAADTLDDWRLRLGPWLREQAAAGALMGGLGCGAAWLADAGLLAGYRATAHHAQVAWLVERHPRTVFSSSVYEIDRDRLSCGPGTASLDLMIAWLSSQHGEAIVAPLLAHFGLERLRGRDERQRAPVAAQVRNAKVSEAVALMEANLHEPLPADEIARLVGVSRRQLERLFKQYLDDMPSRYYIELRLSRARRLLRHSGHSVLQIALACGFASASHFSNAYRARYGRTPRDERSPRAADWTAQRTPAALSPSAELPADDARAEEPPK
ncbi:MAG: GlxA family transcriptional regulator [Rubrivivax sp.]